MRKKLSPTALLVPLIFLPACLDSPVAPSWTVNGSTALLKATLSAIEIVSDSDSAIIDENTRLFFLKSVDLKDFNPGDSIEIEDKIIEGIQTLDSLKADQFESDPLLIKPSVLNSALTDNYSGPVPAFNFTVNNQDFTGLTEYEYAILEPGTTDHPQNITLTITNQLSFPVTLTSITLKDKKSGTTLATQTLNKTVDAGGQGTSVISLGGKTITNQMQLSFKGSSTGASNTTLSSSSGISFALVSDELYASEIKGNIAGSSYNSTEEIDAGMEDFIPSEIIIKAGQLVYQLKNTSQLTGVADVTIPELTLGGKVYQSSLTLPADSTVEIKPDIAGGIIKPTSKGGTSAVLTVKVNFKLNKASGVTVKKTDQISWTAGIKNISHRYAAGTIKEQAKNSDPDTSDVIDWPDELKNVTFEFDEATITARLASSLGIPAEVSPRILFDYPNKTHDSLTFSAGVFPMSMAAATKASPYLRQERIISISQMNGFNTILNKKPEKLRYYVAATAAKGGYSNGFVYDTSQVRGTLELKIPMRLKSPSGYEKDSLYEFEPGTFDGVKLAKLIVDCSNRLPVKVSLSLEFKDNQGTTVLALPGNDWYSIAAAPVGTNGRSTGYAQTQIQIVLREADLTLVEKATGIFLRYRIDTAPSGGPSKGYSEIMSTDDLKLSIGAELQYKVNAE